MKTLFALSLIFISLAASSSYAGLKMEFNQDYSVPGGANYSNLERLFTHLDQPAKFEDFDFLSLVRGTPKETECQGFSSHSQNRSFEIEIVKMDQNIRFSDFFDRSINPTTKQGDNIFFWARRGNKYPEYYYRYYNVTHLEKELQVNVSETVDFEDSPARLSLKSTGKIVVFKMIVNLGKRNESKVYGHCYPVRETN